MNVFQDFKMTYHGGARQGAGRKKNGSNAMNEEARLKAIASGESPLDFLLNAMRDEKAEFTVRLDAAKAAAPYIHARLSSVDMTSKTDGTLKVISDTPLTEEEWVAQANMVAATRPTTLSS